MTSFQISVSPSRRAAARFVMQVRRAFQKALAEEARASGLTQAEIARRLSVHRSVISRELMGTKDITLGRVGELASAMGRQPTFELPRIGVVDGSNAPRPQFIYTNTPTSSGMGCIPLGSQHELGCSIITRQTVPAS